MRKKLGLWMERRGSGYRVVLCEDTRRRIHLLFLGNLNLSVIHSDSLRFQHSKEMKIADVLTARSNFIVLQVLDLTTTLIAFHFGAFEVNPLVGRLTNILGPAGGRAVE